MESGRSLPIFEHVVDDLSAARQIARNDYPELPLVVVGTRWVVCLRDAYAQCSPDDVAGVAFAAR